MATLSIEPQSAIHDSKGPRENASLVNAVIPDLIKRRTGKLPSLRRIFSSATFEKQTELPPPSPPPPYAESQVSDLDDIHHEHELSDVLDRLIGTRGSSSALYALANEKSASNVRWKHVGEGCRLIECAGREAVSGDEDPELARKMFIDGLGYLLKALPDLTPDETAQLSNYLPRSLKPTSEQQMNEPAPSDSEGEGEDEVNYIYNFVTFATMYGVLFGSLMLPILERLVAAMYQCDQRYKIRSRVANTTTQTLSSIAKSVFASLNEGRSGQIALGLSLYAIQGASRGFLDGYERAIKRQEVAERRSDVVESACSTE